MNLAFSKDKKGFYKLLFFIATLVVVFILAVVPNDHILKEYDNIDKLKHLTAFFTLSLLLNQASANIAQRFRNMTILLLFGIGIEFMQHYLPARTSSIEDIFADVGGILSFQVLYSVWKVVRKKRVL